jgi:hypothetical protein
VTSAFSFTPLMVPEYNQPSGLPWKEPAGMFTKEFPTRIVTDLVAGLIPVLLLLKVKLLASRNTFFETYIAKLALKAEKGPSGVMATPTEPLPAATVATTVLLEVSITELRRLTRSVPHQWQSKRVQAKR